MLYEHRQKLALASALLATWLLARNNSLLFNGSWWLTFALFEACLFGALLSWTLILWPHVFSPLRKLPQPTGNSFFNGQFARILKEDSGVPHREWLNEIPNNGVIYYRSFLNSERIFITTPEAHREVLSQKSYEYVKPPRLMQGLTRLLGRGLLVVDGDEHRVQRKNLMPAFSFRHVKDLYPAFWAKARDLVVQLDKEIPQSSSVVDISQWNSRVTLDVIGVAGIGSSFQAIEDPNGELNSCYRNIFTQSRAQRILGILGLFIPFWVLTRLPIKRNYEVKAAAKFLRDYCGKLVAEKRQQLAQGKQSGVDILSVAIESGGFTDESLVNQMMTFLAAGHETTSTALTWTLLFLCQHPDIQKRLREEVQQKLPDIRDPKSTVTPDVLDHMPYLNAVCNESLRFMPPVPMTMRASAEDNFICGEFVPAGTFIVLVPMAINFDKKMWGDDAEIFDPERWLGEGRANTGGAKSNYSFLSFLHGPRSCIGQGFARAEFAALLAGIVSGFAVELEDKDRKIEVQSGITQRVKGGLRVKLTPTKQ